MGVNRESLERAIEAENRGDIDAVAATFAPDATYLSGLGTFTGREAIAGFFRRMGESLPDRHVRIGRVVEEGDWVAWEETVTGTNTGPLPVPGGRTMPPTGKRIELHFAAIAQVENGQIGHVREYLDGLDMMRQLGLMPAPTMAVGVALGELWNRLSPRLRGWRSRGRGGH